jgi:hypothetical protein
MTNDELADELDLNTQLEADELEELREYSALMEFPIESLATAAGIRSKIGHIDDHEIIMIAAGRIYTLKRMILASGFNSDMLNAIMEEE